MKPENAHLISLCWLLVLLVVFFCCCCWWWGGGAGRLQWNLMVQDRGRPRNMTQSWAMCGKEPDMGRRRGGKCAWPLCNARWGVPVHPVTLG